jgi:hypothetical protein
MQTPLALAPLFLAPVLFPAFVVAPFPLTPLFFPALVVVPFPLTPLFFPALVVAAFTLAPFFLPALALTPLFPAFTLAAFTLAPLFLPTFVLPAFPQAGFFIARIALATFRIFVPLGTPMLGGMTRFLSRFPLVPELIVGARWPVALGHRTLRPESALPGIESAEVISVTDVIARVEEAQRVPRRRRKSVVIMTCLAQLSRVDSSNRTSSLFYSPPPGWASI